MATKAEGMYCVWVEWGSDGRCRSCPRFDGNQHGPVACGSKCCPLPLPTNEQDPPNAASLGNGDPAMMPSPLDAFGSLLRHSNPLARVNMRGWCWDARNITSPTADLRRNPSTSIDHQWLPAQIGAARPQEALLGESSACGSPLGRSRGRVITNCGHL